MGSPQRRRGSARLPGFRAGTWAPAILAALLAALVAEPARVGQAASPLHLANPFKADNSDETRQAAIQLIPTQQLDAAAQAKVSTVLSNVTVYRRMPVKVVDCDPELYLLLVRHPDVVVNIWEVLGVTQVQMRQIRPAAYQLSDNAGTQGFAEFLWQSPTMHLIYGEGCYKGVFTPRPVTGRCLLIICNGYLREADGRAYVTTRLDSFLSVEPGAIELIAKTLQPLVGRIADANYTQTVAFASSLSRTAEVNHRGVERLSTKLTHVQPEVRQQLATVAERLGNQYAASGGAAPHPGGPSPAAAAPLGNTAGAAPLAAQRVTEETEPAAARIVARRELHALPDE